MSRLFNRHNNYVGESKNAKIYSQGLPEPLHPTGAIITDGHFPKDTEIIERTQNTSADYPYRGKDELNLLSGEIAMTNMQSAPIYCLGSTPKMPVFTSMNGKNVADFDDMSFAGIVLKEISISNPKNNDTAVSLQRSGSASIIANYDEYIKSNTPLVATLPPAIYSYDQYNEKQKAECSRMVIDGVPNTKFIFGIKPINPTQAGFVGPVGDRIRIEICRAAEINSMRDIEGKTEVERKDVRDAVLKTLEYAHHDWSLYHSSNEDKCQVKVFIRHAIHALCGFEDEAKRVLIEYFNRRHASYTLALLNNDSVPSHVPRITGRKRKRPSPTDISQDTMTWSPSAPKFSMNQKFVDFINTDYFARYKRCFIGTSLCDAAPGQQIDVRIGA